MNLPAVLEVLAPPTLSGSIVMSEESLAAKVKTVKSFVGMICRK